MKFYFKMKSNLMQITFSAIEFTGAFIYTHWLKFNEKKFNINNILIILINHFKISV